jgi:hypothetical protein
VSSTTPFLTISPGAKVSNLSSELGSDTANKFQEKKEIHSFWSLVDYFLLHLAAQVSTPLWSGICRFLLWMVVVFFPTSYDSAKKITSRSRPVGDQSIIAVVNGKYLRERCKYAVAPLRRAVDVRRSNMVLWYEALVLSFAIHNPN